MQNILLVIHLFVTIALIITILFQRSEGGALGMGGSGGGGFMTARGSKTLLTRATSLLATVFICLSLMLAILAKSQEAPRSIIDNLPVDSLRLEQPAASTSEPEQAPAVPLAQ